MVAYLPGQSTMEISMTSGQFNADLFALANGTNFGDDATYTTYTTEHLTPDASAHTVTLANTPVANSVSIAGMELGDSAAEETSGTPAHDEVPAVPAANAKFAITGKVITFPSSITGEVEISYEYTVTGAKVAQIDNATSAIGEAVFKWPVYNSGEDCTDAAIKGYVIMKVYRCRVTQMPKHNWAYWL